MKTMLIACFCVFSAACNALSPYPEFAEGRTATVYACGEWQPAQLTQIQAAIADWNAGVTLATGNAPYAYGGQKPEMATYDENNVGDGVHCVYQLINDTKYAHRNNLTDYGRQLWNDYHLSSDDAAGLYDNDDIVIFNEDPDLLNPLLGPHATWMMQGVAGHEIGHAGGLGHQAQDAESLMTPKVVRTHTTMIDHQHFCQINHCL